MKSHKSTAIFGAGCFWCYQHNFDSLKGVLSTRVGYTGGLLKNPEYSDVCRGDTGHAEAIEITYDKTQIKYSTLVEVFFAVHDPTTLNRQGNDVGTQYRSAIFYTNKSQMKIAMKIKSEMQKNYTTPIVTEISESSEFYTAEKYHQNFFINNPNHGYCRAIISPKWEKFRSKFAHLFK